MNQPLLMSLLEKAADLHVAPEVAMGIQAEIETAMREAISGMHGEDKVKRTTLHEFANELLVDVFRNRRDLLPSLFPVFAKLCESRVIILPM